MTHYGLNDCKNLSNIIDIMNSLTHTHTHTQKCQKNSDIPNLSIKGFEHVQLPGKLLDYFLRSNESNINQYMYMYIYVYKCMHTREGERDRVRGRKTETETQRERARARELVSE